MGEKRSDMAPISRKDSSKSDFYATPGATGIVTPSSRHRVDGVEDDAMIQHERAVKF